MLALKVRVLIRGSAQLQDGLNPWMFPVVKWTSDQEPLMAVINRQSGSAAPRLYNTSEIQEMVSAADWLPTANHTLDISLVETSTLNATITKQALR